MSAGIRLLVTAGRGPAECAQAVRGVALALLRAAEAADVSVACDAALDAPQSSVVLSIGGAAAAAFVAGWLGTVLWIDPAARGRGGRKNWYVGVASIDDAPAPLQVCDADVRFETMRAGGPGGQHQNTTDSAVRVVHLPTGLAAMARDGRSQHQNRKLALDRLAELLALVAARAQRSAAQDTWEKRISVVRGNPVRTLRAP